MSREVLDSRSSYDELFDDRPERDRGPRPPRRLAIPPSWSTKLRSLAPLLAAFAVGLAVGAAGWNEWLAQREVAAARSTVSFEAQISSAEAARNGVEAFVRVTNTGPEAVFIDGVEMIDPAIRSSSWWGNEPIEVMPDKAVVRRLFLELDCEVRASSEPLLSMRVRTVDGVARSAELPIEDNDDWLDSATSVICPDPNDGFIPLQVSYNGRSSVIDVGGPALQMPISLGTWEPIDVTLLSMRASSDKLSVAVDGLPLQIRPEGSPGMDALTATWRVTDCRDAEDLRFDALGFVIEVQRPGGNLITTRVYPEPDLALEVARFISTSCPAA
jgi:hypothetical protein